MKIDLRELAALLSAVEGKQTFDCRDIYCRNAPDYVLKHIYEPLLQGKELIFADLDFEAFNEDDLNALEEWINDRGYAFSRLCRLNEHFSNAVPVSAAVRAFC